MAIEGWTNFLIFFSFQFLVHEFYSSHVHQMTNQQATRQSPTDPSIHASSPMSNASHPIHNSAASYYHHYHHPAANANQNSAGYSPPQTLNQSESLNGNESPNSVDQFSTSHNTIQLPETPNSLGTTIMGPTSGNSNSNDGNKVINSESSPSENAAIITNNNNYSPWCASTGHHQIPLSNSSPLHSSSYNTAHQSASLYSAHHNLSSTLIPHQNISGFAHPHGPSKGFGMPQSFYSWY